MDEVKQMLRRCLGEFCGTMALVFAGTGAIVVNDVQHGAISHVGIALTFGLVVMAMIYAFGDLSGAHLNPAVSLGFWVARRLPGRDLVPYVASQISGALTASGLIALTFPEHRTLGATLPSRALPVTFLWETLLTFLLMLVIIRVAIGSKETGTMAGVAIGSTVCLEALFAGPITGASMNPARSFAPALVSGQFDGLWLYLTAPLLGAVLAIGAWRLMLSPARQEKTQHP